MEHVTLNIWKLFIFALYSYLLKENYVSEVTKATHKSSEISLSLIKQYPRNMLLHMYG